VLVITYLVTCATAFGSFEAERRGVARKQLTWWTVLGVGVFAATLVNPYGIKLLLWNLWFVTDPFLQTMSNTEWFPPNFASPGWFRIELLVLLFPALAALSRRQISLLTLALGVAWLHFALTTSRYSPLWVVVVIPTLATLSTQVPWLDRAIASLAGRLSADAQEWLAETPKRWPCFISVLFAGLALFVSPWAGDLAGHNQDLIPSRSLDRLLQIYRGERVFHWANWGGYLTWHGWDLNPRFKTWIDDRIDIHGQAHTEKYRAIINARPDWEELLRQDRVELLCIPPDVPLASRARESPGWRLIYEDRKVVVFRRLSSGTSSAAVPIPGVSDAAAASWLVPGPALEYRRWVLDPHATDPVDRRASV
jgi:hypothetical protein